MTNYQHIAEQMYAAYCQQAGGLTFDGKPYPRFKSLALSDKLAGRRQPRQRINSMPSRRQTRGMRSAGVLSLSLENHSSKRKTSAHYTD